MALPDIDETRKKVLAVALQIKVAREKKVYNCPCEDRGCFAYKPYEAILKGKAEYLGIGGYGQDIYFL